MLGSRVRGEEEHLHDQNTIIFTHVANVTEYSTTLERDRAYKADPMAMINFVVTKCMWSCICEVPRIGVMFYLLGSCEI